MKKLILFILIFTASYVFADMYAITELEAFSLVSVVVFITYLFLKNE